MVSALCLAILISSLEEVREEERHRVRSGLRLPTDAERCNSSQGEEVGGGCNRSWCCPVSPQYTVEELTTCQGRKKCNKDPKTRTAICQMHQFRPFDRIAGRTDTMTCSARLEQLFLIARYIPSSLVKVGIVFRGSTSFFHFFIDI